MQIGDELGEAGLGADISPDIRIVVRIRREVMLLNPGVAFRYGTGDMGIRLG
jgi:hypothetical protein